MTYELADGTALPEGERQIHRHQFHKTSLGSSIELHVIETRYPTVMMLVATANAGAREHFPYLAPEYLTAIVAHYIAEGWTLLSMNGDTAAMSRR